MGLMQSLCMDTDSPDMDTSHMVVMDTTVMVVTMFTEAPKDSEASDLLNHMASSPMPMVILMDFMATLLLPSPLPLAQPVLLDTQQEPLLLPEAHKVSVESDQLNHSTAMATDTHMPSMLIPVLSLALVLLVMLEAVPPTSPEAYKVLASKY